MHRIFQRSLAPALLAGVLLTGAGRAQAVAQTKGPLIISDVRVPLSVDDVVERIMAFDKNKDGKVTRDELPERMHHLIEQGDSNKDGALDKDEIRELAIKLGATAPATFGERYQEVPAGVAPASGRFSVGRDAVEGVVEDLKLSGKKKEQALAAAKAHQENVRKLMEQARTELLANMREILSAEELKDFRAALDRQAALDRARRAPVVVRPFDTPKGAGPKKIDPPQK
jgi:EF hand domain-containing protein